jgi:hypothetical protein
MVTPPIDPDLLAYRLRLALPRTYSDKFLASISRQLAKLAKGERKQQTVDTEGM